MSRVRLVGVEINLESGFSHRIGRIGCVSTHRKGASTYQPRHPQTKVHKMFSGYFLVNPIHKHTRHSCIVRYSMGNTAAQVSYYYTISSGLSSPLSTATCASSVATTNVSGKRGKLCTISLATINAGIISRYTAHSNSRIKRSSSPPEFCKSSTPARRCCSSSTSNEGVSVCGE